MAVESTRSIESLKIKFCGDITSKATERLYTWRSDKTIFTPFRISYRYILAGPSKVICSNYVLVFLIFVFTFYKCTIDMYGVIFSSSSTLTEHLLKNFWFINFFRFRGEVGSHCHVSNILSFYIYIWKSKKYVLYKNEKCGMIVNETAKSRQNKILTSTGHVTAFNNGPGSIPFSELYITCVNIHEIQQST